MPTSGPRLCTTGTLRLVTQQTMTHVSLTTNSAITSGVIYGVELTCIGAWLDPLGGGAQMLPPCLWDSGMVILSE